MTHDVRIAADAQALSAAVAREVAGIIAQAVEARGRCTLALSGGTTPRALYARLAAPPFRSEVPWPRCEFFWGDERAVLPEHAESNYRMARETLLDPLAIDSARVHRMPAERADLDAAARDYEAELMQVLAQGGATPQLDLVLLGLGADGHTASLFPGGEALACAGRWVSAERIAAPGFARMTLTLTALNAARSALFIVAGGEKSGAVARVLEPSGGDPLPAARVKPAQLLWRLDRAAAAGLRGAYPSS
jgi:6-phosphogluconolactonase